MEEGPPLPARIEPGGPKTTWFYGIRRLELHRGRVVTEPSQIYRALLLPHIVVELVNDKTCVFENHTGGFIPWLVETFIDKRPKRRQRAIRRQFRRLRDARW